MASIRIERRGEKSYRYLVQSYRWEGTSRQKSIYIGDAKPPQILELKKRLERAIFEETWFKRFELIKDRYQARQQSLPPSVYLTELEEFVVDFTYDTNKIEGSTLTREETRNLLERGHAPSRPVRDVLEAQHHARLFRRLMANPEPLDLHRLLAWHRELFLETKPDIAGHLRNVEVGIRGSQHLPPPPLECRPMLVELLRRTNKSIETENAVYVAGEFHWRFEYIHPFADGNGRVGRVAMNMLLTKAGYPPINIPYVGRAGYYRALERASLSDEPRAFLLWFFRKYVSLQSLYLRAARAGPSGSPPHEGASRARGG